MKAGLLQCDHVDSQYLYIDGDYQDMFQSLFPNFEWHIFDVINGEFPGSAEECEVYLCTGSRHSAYDELNWIFTLKSFIKNMEGTAAKMIGVCFGHQMVAEALGGKVEKAANGWNIGNHSLKILRHKKWMKPGKDELRLQMMCQDQVVELPQRAEILASTNTCPVAMYTVDNQFLSIQGHPEFSRTYAQALIINRTDRIGGEKVREGLKSLDKSTDHHVFKEWVMHFLKR